MVMRRIFKLVFVHSYVLICTSVVAGMDRLPTFLTIPQFLREFPVGRTRFYEDVRAGRIRVLKSGARTLVPASELDRLAREATCDGPDDGDRAA
jgi:hypothetical protein